MSLPGPGLYPSSGTYPAGIGAILRDRPPLRLALHIETPDGHHARWAGDEHNPANVPSNLSFSTTMPGGFEQLSVTLPRKPGLDYADLQEFSTVTAYGSGGDIAWEGRLETVPRTSGEQVTVAPGAVGHQAHLDDNATARMVYVDCDLSRWQAASVQRKIGLLNINYDCDDSTVTPDQSTGAPSVVTQMQGPWSRQRVAEAWYDAKGVPIGAVYYAWKLQTPGAIGDDVSTNANWQWAAFVSDDDIATTVDTSGNLRAAGPGAGSLTASTATRKWALLELTSFSTAGGTSGVNYPVFWQAAVVGRHGLPLYTGSGPFPTAPCVLASDVVRHAVTTWAPKLATSRAGQSTIETTTFQIAQLAFLDPTTASAVVKAAIAFELLDWWVDEGPTFNLASRANHGRFWRARVGPSGLQETGPQVDRMHNSVVVSFNDVTGATRTVGPTGSGANTIDDTLADTDPTNPVNVAGLDRPYAYPNIGVDTVAGASAVGRRFLLEQRQAVTSGQASIVGHVQDDRGVWWPAWRIRAGDWISFTDAHDTSSRRIVRTQYSDASRTCQLDLDSPPESLSATLARMAELVVGRV